MRIVEAIGADLDTVRRVEREAFGQDDEAQLVDALLRDPTAQPAVSLLAWEGDHAIGHVLFTRVTLKGADADVACAILAPLAVVPAHQRQGVGRALIEHGAERLAQAGVALVFVLGDPAYYARSGFSPAAAQGLQAPYPFVHEPAWQVRPLVAGLLGTVSGAVVCASALAPSDYWRE